jgi:putative ABC transport system permease protein
MKHTFRYALRSLARTPGFTLTTILTLAVAIGASTAIFSVVNGVLLKPLPFPDSDRLIALTHRIERVGRHLPASAAIYFTYRDHNQSFESVALWASGSASVTGSGNPEEVRALDVTHEFLPTLGVQPFVGRAFAEADDRPGADGTVILSYGYWQRHFGGAQSALGQTLTVDGVPRTVIGVLPQDFRLLQQPADILRPMAPQRTAAFVGPLGESGLARLKPGVTLEQASADVERMIPIMLEEFTAIPTMDPKVFPNLRLHADLLPLKRTFVRDLPDVLRVLMGTVGMLLLIACANIANLRLVRCQARAQDLAIRTALGATRGAIARILLLESLLLGLAGGLLGLALAAAALPALLALAARDLPTVLAISIDPTVLLFTLAVSIGSSVFVGAIAVFKHTRPRVATALRSAGRSESAGPERHRATNALVVAQVAIALVLLVASGLMIRTYQSLRDVDPGFADPDRLLTVTLGIPAGLEPSFDRVVRIQNDLQDRLAEVPGVEAVAYASQLPLSFGPSITALVEDEALDQGQAPAARQFRFASPGLFAALRTPLRAGRAFEWTDVYEKRQVAVVSENFARAIWGEPGAALGRRVRLFDNEPWREIVGVVGDVHQTTLDRPAEETIYLPQNHFLAQYSSRAVQFAVRSERVGTAGFLEEVQRAIWSVNGSLPLAGVATMDDAYRQALARTSLTLTLLALTAAMALSLGLLGIYGVISYTLAQRTREIGVRMALGARAAQLRRMLLRQVLLLVTVGVALGIGGAAALTRLMESMLFGVTALDAPTFAAMAATLVAAAIVAGYLPARRVTRIDPMRALREE